MIKDELITILENRFGNGINTYSNLLNKKRSPSETMYCINHNINTPPKCLNCGSNLKYQNYKIGYFEFCSSRCFSLYLNTIKEDAEIEDKELYIHDFNLQIYDYMCFKFGENYTDKNMVLVTKCLSSNFKDSKRSEIAKSIFKCRNTLFNSNMSISETLYLITNKMVENPKCTMCNNSVKFDNFYNGYRRHCSKKCAALDPKTQEKLKNTNLERHGFEFPLQRKEVKEKSKSTCMKKYGVENYTKTNEYKTKSKSTSLQKYGVEHYSSTDECKMKVKSTCFEKFGTENAMQNKKIKFKLINKFRILFFQKLISSDRLQGKCIPLFEINDFSGVNHNNKYKFKCTKCDNEFEDHLDDGHIPRCPICYPKTSSGTSSAEKEVFEFCQSLVPNVEQSNRSILNSKELDIYVPEKQLAIEYDGLYWHGDKFNSNGKKYHLSKTLECLKHGIQLIHVFEDEWFNKQDIVKSVISSKLSKYKNRYFARKCTIREIDNFDTKQFLFDNHLQGPINSKVNIGLFSQDDELISLMTFSKPRYNKNYDWEIIRYCSKLNTQIVGGMGKLFSYFKRTYNPPSIITYCDRRYGEGRSYEKIGFNFLKSSEPSYFYLVDHQRESRIKYQKHKLNNLLETFDSNLTEWENMQLNGYDRIWDCGHNAYEYKIQ